MHCSLSVPRERERGHLAFKDADNPNAGSICHGTNWTHVSAVPKSDHWPASPSCFHLAALHFLYGFWVLTGAKWISALLEVSITCDEPMIFFYQMSRWLDNITSYQFFEYIFFFLQDSCPPSPSPQLNTESSSPASMNHKQINSTGINANCRASLFKMQVATLSVPYYLLLWVYVLQVWFDL